MSLTKEFFNRSTNITAKVICDSINEQGIRITTLEVEAPRIVLAEINTHNAISKNCSSTRAITLKKAIQQIRDNGFEPLYLGKKQSGMSAEVEINSESKLHALYLWSEAKDEMIHIVERLDNECELHKQISGRLLEPFQMVKQVLTATDWDNFFNLRIHPDAQPEILMLAYKIYKAIEASVPNTLRCGEFHLPYLEISQDQYNPKNTYYYIWNVDTTGTETDGYKFENTLTLDQAIKYSIARCASVSYRTEEMTLEKSQDIYNRLLEADVLHSSPAEHVATPVKKEVYLTEDTGCGYDIDERRSLNVKEAPSTWEKGITHVNRQGELCSANFRGWIQYRHTLKNNTCYEFNFEERTKMFC